MPLIYKPINHQAMVRFNGKFSQRLGSLPQASQHSVHPTGGGLRVFRRFARLEVGSVKVALSRPAHLRVMLAVRRQ